VLVIGAGGAGLRAAIEASSAGVSVGLVCKSLLGKAHTVMAEGGMAAALGNVDDRDDWKVVDDPLGVGGGPVVLLPAIKPDVALFHSPRADSHGNVWIGRRRELMTLAHASASTLVTVEVIEGGDFLSNEATAAGTLPALYVTAIAKVRDGAKPMGLTGHYERDMDHIRAYAEEAKTEEGFRRYLEREVLGRP